MEHEKARTTGKKYREATPEEMAEFNRLADEAERYHFGCGIDEGPHSDAAGPPRHPEPGADSEAEVSPSVVVVDQHKTADQ